MKRDNPYQFEQVRRALSHYPIGIFESMLEIAGRLKTKLYLSGGALRDLLLGVTPNDLDFTICRGAVQFLEEIKMKIDIKAYKYQRCGPIKTSNGDFCTNNRKR